ncbi:MAG TPA: hypothetical protein VLG16_00870 [Candidatus Saccharimonadales bacterium]|nr:hypothetical protein [Candidatus Saccharimonadales bacterium]
MPQEQSSSNLPDAHLQCLRRLPLIEGMHFKQGEFAITEDAVAYYGLYRLPAEADLTDDELARPQQPVKSARPDILPRIIVTTPDEFLLSDDEAYGCGYEISGQRATFWLTRAGTTQDAFDVACREALRRQARPHTANVPHERSRMQGRIGRAFGGLALDKFAQLRLQQELLQPAGALYAHAMTDAFTRLQSESRLTEMRDYGQKGILLTSALWLAERGYSPADNMPLEIVNFALVLGALAIPGRSLYKAYKASEDGVYQKMCRIQANYRRQFTEFTAEIAEAYSPETFNTSRDSQ